MANNCKVDFMSKEIRISKTFYNAAQVYGTEEFGTLLDLQTKLPAFKIVFQNHPTPKCKVWYPTYTQMMEYINFTTSGDQAAITELHDTIELARITGKGYNMVRRWFCEKYGDTFRRQSAYEYAEAA